MASRVDEMNRLAASSPGHVWRFEPDGKKENQLSLFSAYLQSFNEARFFFNMSIWTDLDSLNAYVYKSTHSEMITGRDSWVEELDVPSLVSWKIEMGRLPTVREAVQRFQEL